MRFSRRLLGFVVLLPMALAAIGGWEVTRSTGDALVPRLRLVLACLATGGGGIALLSGMAGLALAWHGAARAKTSRDALLAGFSRMAALLPAILGGMVGGMCMAAAGITLFEILDLLYFVDLDSAGMLRLAVLGLALAGGVMWVAVRTLRDLRRALAQLTPAPRLLLGRVVAPQDAPGLFALVADVAARTKAGMPDFVMVGLTQGFFVTASDMLAVPEGKLLHGRILHLSAGMLAVFDAAETAAVISHELAHFTGADTSYSRRFLPVYQRMARSLDAVAAGLRPLRHGGLPMRAAVLLGQEMQARFHGAVSHWSRLREFAADQATLATAGAPAAARALLRSVLVAPVVARVIGEAAARPGNFRDLVDEIFLAVATVPLGDPVTALAEREPHPFDSHPATGERIAAFGVTVDEELAARARRPAGAAEAAFADSVFADWAGLRKMVSADLLDRASLGAARRRSSLTADVEAADEVTEIFETAPWGEMLASSGLALGGLLIGGIFLYAGVVDWGDDSDLLVLCFGLFLTGSGWYSAAIVATALWRARSGAVMVVSREAVLIRGLPRRLCWSAVDDVRLRWRRSVTVTFTLRPGADLARRGFWLSRLRGDGRRVVLAGMRPRGMKPRDLMALLSRYRQAHAASLELAGGEVSDADSTARDP